MSESEPDYVDPIDRHHLALVVATWKPLAARFEARPCSTPAQKDWWATQAAHAQSVLKGLEEDRVNLTRPLLESKRRVDEEFAKTAEHVKAFKALASRKMSEYDLAIAEAERKALAEARAAAETGDAEAAVAIVAAVPERVATAGTATTYSWKFEAEDIDRVPAAFVKKTLDTDAVKAYLKTVKGSNVEPAIEGVRFTRTASTRVTGRGKS